MRIRPPAGPVAAGLCSFARSEPDRPAHREYRMPGTHAATRIARWTPTCSAPAGPGAGSRGGSATPVAT